MVVAFAANSPDFDGNTVAESVKKGVESGGGSATIYQVPEVCSCTFHCSTLPTLGFPACRLCPRRSSRRCTPPPNLTTPLPPRPISHSTTASSSGTFHGVASSVQRPAPDYRSYTYSISTRYGSWPAQLKTFWDSTGQLWQSGALAGKFVGAFVSTAGTGGGL